MPTSTAISLARAAIAILALSRDAIASPLPQADSRHLESLKDQHDAAIRTDPQACVQPTTTNPSGVAMLVSFAVGMLVMFAAKYAFDQWKES